MHAWEQVTLLNCNPLVTCNIEATDAYGHEVLGFRFIKGLSYTLTCSCQNLNEAIDYYQWSKNDSSLFGEVRSTLSLSLLKLSDAGRYTCSATLSDVHYTSSIDIIIQSKFIMILLVKLPASKLLRKKTGKEGCTIPGSCIEWSMEAWSAVVSPPPPQHTHTHNHVPKINYQRH